MVKVVKATVYATIADVALDECYLLISCRVCHRTVIVPPILYIERMGNVATSVLKDRLRCSACGGREPSLRGVEMIKDLRGLDQARMRFY